ncbi:helix-turn-helix transcriptional regulator [Sanguibacter sp. A247]|uniref:helix-turn-helix transcriptional regulator n=1 Tax=unclassified Sanguibacter TaxID=2645534 RepID=UPI003FD88282
MEITPRPGYGPAAAVPRPSPAAALSRARRQVLELLVDRGVPTSVATLADELGQHTNTVREHLEGLADAGYAERTTARPSGRGRPGTLYEAVPPPVTDSAASEYAGLASVLADQIARTSPDPRSDALAAGARWGLDLMARAIADGHVQSSGVGIAADACADTPASHAADARRHVVRLLDRLGFAPAPDADSTRIELRRCPLLDAALRTPEVVCAVHLGLARGALDALATPSDGTTLEPFALPGACLLHLETLEA